MTTQSSIFKKIYIKGWFWFIARILQEVEAGTGRFIKLLRPIVRILFFTILYPVHKVQSQVNFKNRPVGDTLYLFYDLEVAPVTFDFAWALAIAAIHQKDEGYKKIQVIFVPGNYSGLREESPDYEACVDLYSRQWRKTEILYALCNLVSVCAGVTFCGTREEAYFLCEKMRPHVLPVRYSTTFPITCSPHQLLASDSKEKMVFQATKQAKQYIDQWLKTRQKNRRLITITLRSSVHMPARNNNIQAWAAFAKTVDSQEYFLVFIPDTDSALNEIPNELKEFTLFNEPAWNLNLRAALYELSYLNLGVNNGSMILCWLNAKCRYITFKMMVKNVPQTQEATFKKQGFQIGKSLPFATEYQKWVWENDDALVIEREFKSMCLLLERSGACMS